MGFFDFFQAKDEKQIHQYGTLFESLQKEFPAISEENLVLTSCVAGLMARLANTDFHLDPKEIEQMKTNLKDWQIDEQIDQDVVVKMAVDHIQELAGLENHLYVYPLKTRLSKEQRYKVLQSLFLVAASDGTVDNIESEEIKLICHGLELSSQHFIAARAEVIEFINALR